MKAAVKKVLLDNLAWPFRCCRLRFAGPRWPAPHALSVSIVMATTIRVIEGGKRNHGAPGLHDRPELGPAPWRTGPRNYLSRLKDRQQGSLFLPVDRYGPAVAEVNREVTLKLANGGAGWPLAYWYLGKNMDEEGPISMPNFQGQPAPLWRVGKVPGESPRPWTFDAAEDHRDPAADPDPFTAAALRCMCYRLLCPAPQETAAPLR